MKDYAIEEILASLSQNKIKYAYYGDRSIRVSGFSPIVDYQRGTLTWIKSKEKYVSLESRVVWNEIDLAVMDSDTKQKTDGIRNAIVCENPKNVFYTILENFFTQEEKRDCIGKYSVVESGAKIEVNVYIGSNCYIGNKVRICEGTRIGNNVVIEGKVYIGRNCRIKSGAVIGGDGYGYRKEKEAYYHTHHFGGVRIGDNVDIGSNTCIDKGSMSDTVIGCGSKIDNLCHIAHNVRIGNGVMVVAGAVIAGSAEIGDNAYIAPGAIVRNQISVGQGSLIGMGGVLTEDAGENYVYMGVPAKSIREVKNENL